MTKRTIVFGEYDTADHGWTLAALKLSDPEQKTLYVDKAGGDGAWDLSTAMTDGIPRYEDRALTAALECSEGTRLERLELVGEMINLLDGFRWDIVLPDYPDRYINGRVRITEEYNDLAHARVEVTATCEPWIYSDTETLVPLTASASKQSVTLTNGGRRAVVPTIEVSGSGADVLLEYGASSLALSAGTYQWATLLLTPGAHTLTYSGVGTVSITYREAVLK